MLTVMDDLLLNNNVIAILAYTVFVYLIWN